MVTVAQAGSNFVPVTVRTTLATGFQAPAPVAVDANGNVYFADRNAGTLHKVDTAGVVTQLATGLNGPQEIAVDNLGNAFIANYSSGTISKWDGVSLSTLANIPFAKGIAFDPHGALYASGTAQG